MVRITRAIEFSASLRYRLPGLPVAENRRRFGARGARQGHNSRLEVTRAGEPDPVTGMVMDLKDLQEVLDREIMQRFDHRDLNVDTAFFEKLPPTPENLVRVIREILREALPAGTLDRVRLAQEPDLWVDLVEPAEPTGRP